MSRVDLSDALEASTARTETLESNPLAQISTNLGSRFAAVDLDDDKLDTTDENQHPQKSVGGAAGYTSPTKLVELDADPGRGSSSSRSRSSSSSGSESGSDPGTTSGDSSDDDEELLPVTPVAVKSVAQRQVLLIHGGSPTSGSLSPQSRELLLARLNLSGRYTFATPGRLGYRVEMLGDVLRALTPRRRRLQEYQLGRSATITTPRGSINKVSFFASKQRKVGTERQARDLLSILPVSETKSFNVRITPADITNVPPRELAKSQNTVMGGSADDCFESVLTSVVDRDTGLELDTKNSSHWGHLCAYCLAAGAVDTQVEENLTGMSKYTNWSMKHYEMRLRKFLSDNSVTHIDLQGSAQEYAGTDQARSVTLAFTFYYKDKPPVKGSVVFDAHRERTERSWAADALFSVMGTVQQRQQEKGLDGTTSVEYRR